MTDTLYILEGMVSGQAKWVCREDIHVYCMNPMREVPGPYGRPAWRRFAEEATYCVVCPDAGLEHGEFVDAPRAAELVDQIHARLGD
jgi:hypothetical protein